MMGQLPVLPLWDVNCWSVEPLGQKCFSSLEQRALYSLVPCKELKKKLEVADDCV